MFLPSVETEKTLIPMSNCYVEMSIPTPNWLKSFKENFFSLVPTISWNRVWQNLQFRLDDFINSIKLMVWFRAQFPIFINFDFQIFQKILQSKTISFKIRSYFTYRHKMVSTVSMLCNHLKLTTRIWNKTYLILIAFRASIPTHSLDYSPTDW